MLLKAAFRRVPASASPAVAPATGKVNSDSVVRAAPGTACAAGGGEISGPANGADVRGRNAREDDGAKRRNAAGVLLLPRGPGGIAKAAGSTEKASPGATAAAATDGLLAIRFGMETVTRICAAPVVASTRRFTTRRMRLPLAAGASRGTPKNVTALPLRNP